MLPWGQFNVQRADVQGKTIFRLLHNGFTHILSSKANIKKPYQIRSDGLHLHHSQLLSNAAVRARAKRHERTLVLNKFGRFIGPSLRYKLRGRGKVAFIALYRMGRHADQCFAGDVASVWECDAFWGCFALDTTRNRGVETHGFVYDAVEMGASS